MRWFIKITMLIGIMLILAVSTTIIATRQQTDPGQMSMLNLDRCNLPCWNGITPGTTTISQAEALLSQAYSQNKGFSIENDRPLFAIHNKNRISTLDVVLEPGGLAPTLSSIEFH